jgi:hypothetical protein
VLRNSAEARVAGCEVDPAVVIVVVIVVVIAVIVPMLVGLRGAGRTGGKRTG